MPAAITDLMDRVTDSTTGRPVISALASPGKAIGAVSINLTDVTNWTTTTAIHFSIYETQVVGGVTVKDPTTQTDWKGTLSGSTISNLTITGGTDRSYTAGAIVELTPTARYAKDLYELLSSVLNQDGTLKSGPIQTALNLGSGSLNGWNALGYAPSTVTALGNRSYQLVFSGVDLTSTLSIGMRMRSTRTVAAPTQCALLNGSTQYFSKSSPAGMTFTDDFVVSAWVKWDGTAAGGIVSRYNGASGWILIVNADGTLNLSGLNASSANYSRLISNTSIPINKWVHIVAQLDMSSFTNSATTSYFMIDGVNVAATPQRAGTNPTALVQAGNLEIGSFNGGSSPFPGKIAQVAVFNSKVTQATMLSYMSQGLAGTETSLISAYSLSNSITDLNTTNANNLTANGSATTTTVDAPWTQDDTGTPGGTNDFMLVTSKAFSTNTTLTVQVPEGCTIPTTGGVTSVVYSTQKVPFGFPIDLNKWAIVCYSSDGTSSLGSAAWANSGSIALNIPIGSWNISGQVTCNGSRAGGTSEVLSAGLSEATTSVTAGYEETFGSAGSGASSGSSPFTVYGTIRPMLTKTYAAATTIYMITYSQSVGTLAIYQTTKHYIKAIPAAL